MKLLLTQKTSMYQKIQSITCGALSLLLLMNEVILKIFILNQMETKINF